VDEVAPDILVNVELSVEDCHWYPVGVNPEAVAVNVVLVFISFVPTPLTETEQPVQSQQELDGENGYEPATVAL